MFQPAAKNYFYHLNYGDDAYSFSHHRLFYVPPPLYPAEDCGSPSLKQFFLQLCERGRANIYAWTLLTNAVYVPLK